ncbi:hypothetical protein Ddye_004881, partial [Dipteronia dyeriana]
NSTNRKYDRKQQKNHWDIEKKDWQRWDSLVRGETRLGWDIERQTIDALSEWWEAKLQKEMDQEFVEQTIAEDMEFDELVLATARTAVFYPQ